MFNKKVNFFFMQRIKFLDAQIYNAEGRVLNPQSVCHKRGFQKDLTASKSQDKNSAWPLSYSPMQLYHLRGNIIEQESFYYTVE